MKKYLSIPLILTILLIIIGCENTNNNIKENIPNEEISIRREYIVNLIEEKLKEQEFIDESNLENFKIDYLGVRGFYKSSSNIKYIVFSIDYTCKDKTEYCIKNIEELPPNYIDFNYSDYIPKIIVLDNYNFIEFKSGLGIQANAGFIEGTEKYILDITNENKNDIINAIDSEKEFIKYDKKLYCDNMYKIETEALFIDENKYTIYCDNEENIEFALDKIGIDLIQKYLYEHGKMIGKEL